MAFAPIGEVDDIGFGFRNGHSRFLTEQGEQGIELAIERGDGLVASDLGDVALPFKSTIQRELLAKRELLVGGLLATEIMDQEIARLGELMTLLYPWDEDGKQITGKSVSAYYWASELRRDYLHMRRRISRHACRRCR